MAQLRKRRRSEEAEDPVTEGYWGKPGPLKEATNDFLCVRASVISTKPHRQQVALGAFAAAILCGSRGYFSKNSSARQSMKDSSVHAARTEERIIRVSVKIGYIVVLNLVTRVDLCGVTPPAPTICLQSPDTGRGVDPVLKVGGGDGVQFI